VKPIRKSGFSSSKDEPRMMRELAVVLAANGYRTDVAENGQEGLTAAAPWQPDAIIVDLALPDQDGIARELTTTLPGRLTLRNLLARLHAALRRARQAGTASRVRTEVESSTSPGGP
jgi:DNA-binding response OmpR family regulator